MWLQQIFGSDLFRINFLIKDNVFLSLQSQSVSKFVYPFLNKITPNLSELVRTRTI